jgi:hypothetical protein
MPNFSSGIPLLLKEPIKLHHLHRDVLEKFDAHPKTPTKIALGICQIFIEIHHINLLWPSIRSLHNFCLPKTEPPIFGFVLMRQTNSMEMFSSSSISKSSSDESYDDLYKHV